MRAIQVRRNGGPEVLELGELDDPRPAADEVVVDVGAAGVNFIDTYQRAGVYPIPTPFVAGQEGAGTIREVGSAVSDLAVGDRVAWTGILGGYAEQAVIKADRAVPVPAGVTDEVAAATMLQGLTAHYLVTSTYPVQAGDWAIVHAAAGGVGLLLTQLIKKRGGQVLATVSTPEKAELATGAGADVIASYDDFADRAREVTGGEGVAVAYDGVGAATFDNSLASLRTRGMLVLFGGSSGQVPPVDPQRLNSGGSLYLTRPTLVHFTRDRAELTGRTDELFGWIADGSLNIRIGARYPLADARKAHEDLEGRRTTGKLLLIP